MNESEKAAAMNPGFDLANFVKLAPHGQNKDAFQLSA